MRDAFNTSTQRVIFYIILALFFDISVGFSQSIEWGNPQKLKNKNLFTQIIGEANGAIYLLRCKNNEFSSEVFLEKYKSNLTLELSVPMPLSVNSVLERVLLVENELTVFMSARNLSTNQIDILSQRLDPSLKPVGQPIVMCSFPASQYIERRKIQIKTNAQKNKVGIMFLTKTPEGSKLHLYGFNGHSQQVFGKQFSIPHESKAIFVSAFDIDLEGNAFVLIDYPKLVQTEAGPNRSFNLYAYFTEADKLLGFELGEGKLAIEELGLSLNNFNKTVSVFGLYTPNDANVVNSYFYERFDISTRQLDFRYTAIVDPSLLDRFISGRLDKTPINLNNLYLRKLVPRSDGGLLVVAERFSRIEQRYSYYLNNMPMEGIRVIYNYDEVAMVSINPNGSIQFIDPIRKKQSSVGENSSAGICVMPTLDNVSVLYNSELDKDGNVMLHSVNYAGKSEERILMKNTNYTVAINPQETKQTSANSLLATVIKDKLFTLVRINF